MSNPPVEILGLPPQDLLAWVRQRIDGELTVNAGFNWHGLAQAAAMNAHEQDESPVWAEIAVHVYSWLARGSEPRFAASFRLSEMHVRAHQVSSFGACAGHPIRDPQSLLEWFHNGRGLTHSQASVNAANWQQLPIEGIARLRAIKNQLGVFVNLLDHVSTSDRNELQGWLDLRPSLP